MADIVRKEATVIEAAAPEGGMQELTVDCEGAKATAICFPSLTGEVKPGDRVLLNVTAVELDLGSGGRHFVMANLSDPAPADRPHPGHIMKLRYTPLQCRVQSAGEKDSPHRSDLESFQSLEGMPVVVCGLHSMVAPICAALNRLSAKIVRIVYIMTDGACLPVSFSRTVKILRSRKLIYRTITCGHSFGGDVETVSKFSALATARDSIGAGITVVSMGVGVVGTGTKLDNTEIETGEWINAVHSLGGVPVAVPRIGFADPRYRHRGISHHTLTALGRIALARAVVPLPVLDDDRDGIIMDQLSAEGIPGKHDIRRADGNIALDALRKYDLRVTTMGRGVEEEPAFFLACGAAARIAHNIYLGR